ncbi:MAG: TRCF domain-containing protein [Phycisphaerales bacterium]
MEAYRRLALAESPEAADAVEEDLRQAYGALPKQAERLVELARLRAAASSLGIRSINVHEQDVIFRTSRPDLLEQHLGDAPGTLRLVSAAQAQRRSRRPATARRSETARSTTSTTARPHSFSSPPRCS